MSKVAAGLILLLSISAVLVSFEATPAYAGAISHRASPSGSTATNRRRAPDGTSEEGAPLQTLPPETPRIPAAAPPWLKQDTNLLVIMMQFPAQNGQAAVPCS